MWQDANENGVTDAGELKTLAALGITSISLSSTPANYSYGSNTVTATGSFTMNGAAREINNVLFSQQQAYSVYIPPAGFAYDAGVYVLPNVRGYGNVPDLWVGMTQNAALKTQVQNLFNQNFSSFNYAAFHAGVEAVLLQWTHGNAVAANSRGAYVNAQHLTAIEALMGQGFSDWYYGANPNVIAGPMLEAQWNGVVDQYAARLLAFAPLQDFVEANKAVADALQAQEDAGHPVSGMTQAQIAAIIDPIMNPAIEAMVNHPLNWMTNISYDYATDGFSGNFRGVVEAFIPGQPADLKAAADYWAPHLPLLNAIAASMHLSETELAGSYSGTILAGLVQPHILKGTSGGDTLNGSADGDLVIGNAGNDTLNGGNGNDTYIYYQGDGSDTIRESGDSIDTLMLRGAALTAANLTVERPASDIADMILHFSGTSGTLSLYGQSLDGMGIERVVFNDGTAWSAGDLRARHLLGASTPGNDTILGFEGIDDFINAGAGNDTVNGSGGDDVIEGGSGQMADVFFKNDNVNTHYIGYGNPASLAILDEVAFLPMSRGYGGCRIFL